jgi:hypothetical protein
MAKGDKSDTKSKEPTKGLVPPGVTFLDKLKALFSYPEDQLSVELDIWIGDLERNIATKEEDLKVLFILRDRIDGRQ